MTKKKNTPHLILVEEDAETRDFKLEKPVTTIGRSTSNDVVIADRFISREHAKVVALDDGGYEVQDLGARHPTKVNGRVIDRCRLNEGDRIRLGNSTLIFASDDSCAGDFIDFLASDKRMKDEVEVASLDAKKTAPFSLEDLGAKDLVSLQKDQERLMLLYEFAKAVNSHLEDPHKMLEEIMNTAFKILDAQRGFIALVDEVTGDLTYELVRDKSSEEEPETLEVSKTIVHKVLSEGVSLLTYNALKDSQFEQAKSVKEYSIRSALCAPLLVRDEILGVVYLDNRASEGIFCRDDLMFLMAMCHQAGIAMGNAWLHRQVVQENIRLEKAVKPTFHIIGESDAMKKVYTTMRKVSPSDITVLIQGETGTGKELVAKAIHALSPRSHHPFIAVNCAAIPRELIESELFGHEKGAFTGAISTRHGKFQIAHEGTIFLDEIGDMSLEIQAKVLRVLEEKAFERVGGTKKFEVDVRVIAATNKDLGKEVEKGGFRDDLFYRLNVVSMNIPPLRDRREDIIPLAEHFMESWAKKISPKAKSLLLAYKWPGNVRELKNCLDRAIVLGDGDVIQPEDLPFNVRRGGRIIPTPLESLEHLEKNHIIRVLRFTSWHKSEAAKILGVTRQTLDNKIAKYDIKR